MKLWLDDIRPAPEGYRWVKSVNEAKVHCCQMCGPDKRLRIEEFNLDHDAGDYAYAGGDYIELLNWLEEKAHVKDWAITSVFKFHSANPVGVQNMRQIVRHNNWNEG